MTSTKTRKRAPEPTRTRSLLWPLVGAVLAAALIVAVIVSLGSEADIDVDAQVGSPAVSGEPLPRFDAAAPAAAAGMAAPTVSGTGFGGEDVAIAADGAPKAIVFLAHWCPHCQAEVPLVEEWLAAGGLPDGTELIGVSTGVDANRDNYPPDAWLEREGWSSPVMRDGAQGEVAGAFGLSAFPFWVILDADHNVVARTTGAINLEAVTQALEALAAN